MSDIVFDRFRAQMRQQAIQPVDTSIRNDEVNQPAIPLSPVVSPDVLKRELLNKLNLDLPTVVKEEIIIKEEPVIELVHFSSIFEFVHWYENNKDFFSNRQREPLNSLIEAKNITFGGCNCYRNTRIFIAEDYFRKFWTQNKSTDLLPTLQKALKTKKILFGDFLAFPEQFGI